MCIKRVSLGFLFQLAIPTWGQKCHILVIYSFPCDSCELECSLCSMHQFKLERSHQQYQKSKPTNKLLALNKEDTGKKKSVWVPGDTHVYVLCYTYYVTRTHVAIIQEIDQLARTSLRTSLQEIHYFWAPKFKVAIWLKRNLILMQKRFST